MQDLNLRPPACEAGALPTELIVRASNPSYLPDGRQRPRSGLCPILGPSADAPRPGGRPGSRCGSGAHSTSPSRCSTRSAPGRLGRLVRLPGRRILRMPHAAHISLPSPRRSQLQRRHPRREVLGLATFPRFGVMGQAPAVFPQPRGGRLTSGGWSLLLPDLVADLVQMDNCVQALTRIAMDHGEVVALDEATTALARHPTLFLMTPHMGEFSKGFRARQPAGLDSLPNRNETGRTFHTPPLIVELSHGSAGLIAATRHASTPAARSPACKTTGAGVAPDARAGRPSLRFASHRHSWRLRLPGSE